METCEASHFPVASGHAQRVTRFHHIIVRSLTGRIDCRRKSAFVQAVATTVCLRHQQMA